MTLRAPDYRERNEARDLKQQSKQELGSCATPRSRPSIERSSRTEHAGVSESPNPGLAQQHAVPGRCTRHSHSMINDSSYCNALRCAPTRCALVRADALCAGALHTVQPQLEQKNQNPNNQKHVWFICECLGARAHRVRLALPPLPVHRPYRPATRSTAAAKGKQK